MITLKAPCVLSNEEWTFHSITYLAQNLSFQYEAEPPVLIGLTNRIPEWKAIKIPEALHLSSLPDLDVISLDQIPTIPPQSVFDIVPRPTIGVFGILLSLVIALIILYKCRAKLSQCKQRLVNYKLPRLPAKPKPVSIPIEITVPNTNEPIETINMS